MLPGNTVDLFGHLRNEVVLKIASLYGESYIPDSILNKVVVSPPMNEKHGDVYTNAALVLGQFLKKAPLEVANYLSDAFKSISGISAIDIVAPGFINFHCTNEVWYTILKAVNRLGKEYGKVDIGHGEKVNVEFVSANPTGPLHIGHARGAVFGDVLSNLLEWVGYNVTREYYINDAGSQINSLVDSVYTRYKEILGEPTSDCITYPGEYLKPIAKELYNKYGDRLLHDENRHSIIRQFTVDSILNLIKDDLSLMGVRHDIFVSEFELQKHRTVEKCISYLQERGIIYNGTLERPKGIEDTAEWCPRVQMLFKSTDFGDDSDRALQKEDGSWTYFAGDIAYHFDKISRGFHKMVLEVGFDHKGYVPRIRAAVKALSNGIADIDVKLHNMVNFLNNGIPVKMSKRKGEFLTVRDVVEEVGKDVARFIMLTRRNDVVLDFDFGKAREQSKNSPIFYIQYAHARICSLIRSFSETMPIEEIDFSVISSIPEIDLIKMLARWPTTILTSAKNYEPHRIAFYLMEIAEAFHSLWGYGNKDANMRFIVNNDKHLTSARIYIARAVMFIIASGLSIFSIVPANEMR